MLHSNNDTFLLELSKLFESSRQTGRSIWITFKRFDGRKTRNPRKRNDRPKANSNTPICDDLVPKEYKCLIRAKSGNKKISLVVAQKDINKFQQSYSNIIRGNINGLKKQK